MTRSILLFSGTFILSLTMVVSLAAAAGSPDGTAANPAGGMTIIVNTLDGGNDGVCGTDGDDPIEDCSLLEAIALANSSPGPHTIGFSVSGIIAISETVLITTPVTIDGTSAPMGHIASASMPRGSTSTTPSRSPERVPRVPRFADW